MTVARRNRTDSLWDRVPHRFAHAVEEPSVGRARDASADSRVPATDKAVCQLKAESHALALKAARLSLSGRKIMARIGRQDRGLFRNPRKPDEWWIEYYDCGGGRHRERGGSKSEARALLERRDTEIRDGSWRLSSKANRGAQRESERLSHSQSITLGEFAALWLEERALHLTPAVIYDYGSLLKTHLLGHPLASMPIGDIMRLVSHLRAQPGYRGRPLSNRRVNMMIARLRTIFATARRRKLVADDPMPYVENLRERKSAVDPFDLNEARRIIEAAEGWERAFVTVLLFTGMRPSEVLALSWNAIDWEHDLSPSQADGASALRVWATENARLRARCGDDSECAHRVNAPTRSLAVEGRLGFSVRSGNSD